jgi:hypothetical protein
MASQLWITSDHCGSDSRHVHHFMIRRPNRIKSLIGHRFGRLVALERFENGHHRCICDCGNETVVSRPNLTTGDTVSCGCRRYEIIHRPRSKPNTRELAIARYYRRNAKVAGRVWAIEQPRFEELISLPCDYCGLMPARGLDRVDSSKGYTLDNVVPCCSTCNAAKMAMSRIEFCSWVRRVFEHLGKEARS